MFRHKAAPNEAENKQQPANAEPTEAAASHEQVSGESPPPAKNLHELMEKNLKWSQIIYEQNRKINHKLLWAAIANWLRLFIILVPLILAIIYFGPTVRTLINQYQALFGQEQTAPTDQKASLEQFFKLFNLTPAQQEQIKSLLK